ncbi:MAG: hypothetical protein M3619_19605, partial [Myxococcota bacterium]|nr:hypothetical protein [Myxococcota bacterium]
HAEHVAMLAEIMSTPPRAIPPEVQHNVAKQHQWLVRAGSRYSAVAMLSWFLFFPILFALGIERLDYVLAVAIPAAVTAGLNLYASRQPHIGRAIQYVMIGTMMAAGMTLSRMFGPLILMPTILATWAIVAQAHPDAAMRRFCLVAVSLAMVVPIVLELAGVVPASYSFSDGRFEVLPQMHGLPTIPTLLFLGLANVAIAVIPAMFVARLRADLSRAQERELVQTWHFRRLGDDLIRASS